MFLMRCAPLCATSCLLSSGVPAAMDSTSRGAPGGGGSGAQGALNGQQLVVGGRGAISVRAPVVHEHLAQLPDRPGSLHGRSGRERVGGRADRTPRSRLAVGSTWNEDGEDGVEAGGIVAPRRPA